MRGAGWKRSGVAGGEARRGCAGWKWRVGAVPASASVRAISYGYMNITAVGYPCSVSRGIPVLHIPVALGAVAKARISDRP